MLPAVRPIDETVRLDALRQYNLLDTLPEQGLDDLTALAARICEAPIALISLVDGQRQWFKSRIGLPFAETPRDVSFCAHAILQPGVFVVPDATRDDRFADNPLVTGAPHMRFYAGAPLVTADGQALGTLCVIDHVPRLLTPLQQEALRVLGRQVMAHLELRRRTRELAESEARLRIVTDRAPTEIASSRLAAIVESSDDAIIGKDLNGIITSWNEGATRLFGHAAAEIVGTSIMRLIPLDRQDEETRILEKIKRGENVEHFETLRQTMDGRLIDVSITASPIKDAAGKIIGASKAVRDITERKKADLAIRQERDRARQYLDTADVVLLALDPGGRVVMINKKGCDLVGWTERELLGRDWIETCLPAGTQDALRKTFHDVVGGDLSVVENTILTRLGEERLMEWRSNTILRDDDGRVIGTLRSGSDITERLRAEHEVRQGAELLARKDREFRELFAANPLPMWIYDLTTLRFLEVNHAAVERYGYGRDEFLAMTIKDIRPPEDVERLLKNVGLSRGPWQATGSWRHRHKSGRILDVDITSHTIVFAGRSAALVVAQDITERKRNEEKQQASEGRYRALFDYAPDGIVIADRESYYIDANPSVCRMLGYSRDELIGLHASDIVVPAEVENIASALRTITARSDYHREWQFRRKDGSVFVADVIASEMPDGNLMAMIQDVTERNEAIEALRTAEERMRFALQSAGVGIWDMDYTTGVLRWSETLEAHYGLEPGTFGGTFDAFVERIHPDDRVSALETVGKAMKAGSDFTVLNRSIWPDGHVRWLSGMGRILLGPQGQPVRGIGISLDVTERRTLEEQFLQAQKMEAIGRLAGGVAHDFNNLLTVILGYCELLLADLDPADRRQAGIAEIQKAGLRAEGLTRQLLAFSRKQIIEPTLLDLTVVVSGMRAMLERLIGEDVKVVFALRPRLACVKADRGQVEQIVLNLAVNARDAMPKGGTLTIETANVELDEHYPKTHLAVKPGPYVVLTVTDTGTGMTPEVQARLYEPFFTTKDVGKGTGLGLATVHGIIQRSGGSVNVYSEVGRGTSFKVYFPADSGKMVVEAPPVAKSGAGAETVLVVEDADGLRELTRKLLERQGYTVLVAANADEALELFEGNASIDVLLTDVVMPGLSGPELTRGLLARRPALKVIYMSGYTEEAIVHHGVLDPGIAFLHKPFTAEALGRKIREALDR